MRRPLLLSLFLLISAVSSAKADIKSVNSGISVFPIGIVIQQQQGTAKATDSFHVVSSIDRTKRFQVEVMSWSINADGSYKLEPTTDILAVPKIFSLPPGADQIVRVGSAKLAPSDREQSYRVILTELPQEGALVNGINITLKLTMPVFVRSTPAQPKLEIATQTTASGVRVKLSNTGNTYLQISQLSIQPKQGKAQPLTVPGGYLLVDGVRSQDIKIPEALCNAGELSISATSDQLPAPVVNSFHCH